MDLRSCIWAFQVVLVKNPPANAGDLRDVGSIPGVGICPGGRHGNPLQYSCLENLMGRGHWQATVHGVIKSQTRLKGLSKHSQRNFLEEMFREEQGPSVGSLVQP